MDRIDFKKVKEMSIYDFLTTVGCQPARNGKTYALFRAPYRKDNHPSLWVNKVRNTWCDLATGQYGDIADLGVALYHITDLRAVISNLERFSPFPLFQGTTSDRIIKHEIRNSGFQDIDVRPLTDWRLLQYIRSRCIDVEVAKKYCMEVHYTTNDRPYFSIGFENVAGGYELRNQYFKGCISPKNISIIQETPNKEVCYLFEGFFDFLSFLTLHLHADTIEFAQDMNYIVLNSVTNVDRAIPELLEYKTVVGCLDNDNAGRDAMLRISEHHPNVHDASGVYADFKDFNEFLIAERQKGA